jgi:hypothetical protein
VCFVQSGCIRGLLPLLLLNRVPPGSSGNRPGWPISMVGSDRQRTADRLNVSQAQIKRDFGNLPIAIIHCFPTKDNSNRSRVTRSADVLDSAKDINSSTTHKTCVDSAQDVHRFCVLATNPKQRRSIVISSTPLVTNDFQSASTRVLVHPCC